MTEDKDGRQVQDTSTGYKEGRHEGLNTRMGDKDRRQGQESRTGDKHRRHKGQETRMGDVKDMTQGQET